MERRRILAALTTLPMAACAPRAGAPGGPGGVAPTAPHDELVRARDEYEALMREHGHHEWARYAGEAKEGADEAAFSRGLRAREHEVVERAARLAAEASHAEPRERALWQGAARGLALLGDAKSVELADALEKVINDFAFEVDKKRVTRGELRAMARSEDAALRRAQRQAYAALHREAAPIARELLKRRRDVAKAGGKAYYDALLGLRGLSTAQLSSMLAALDQRTRAAFAETRKEALARAGLSSFAPWDAELVARKLGDLPDDRFPADKALPTARAIYGAIGVDLDKPKVRIDVRDFAFGGQTISLRVPDDVRAVVTPTPGARFYGTLLHELGHAFATTRCREDNPVYKTYEWIPGLTEPGYEEGVAEIFGRVIDEADALARFVPDIDAKDRAAFLSARARGERMSLRHRLAAIAFERAALESPDGDLDALARKLDREIAGFDVPDDAPAIWATSPFLATYPVYVQSYVVAAVMSAQVRGSLRARFGGSWLRPEAGELLGRMVADGARTTMDEKLVRLTGAGLSVDAYVAWLTT